MDKELLKIIFGIVFTTIWVGVLLFWWLPQAEAGLLGKGELMDQCAKYTNSTSGTRYMFGKCYVKTCTSFETKEVCRGGFIGIGQSCYESSEPHYESFCGDVCIVAKTGERC